MKITKKPLSELRHPERNVRMHTDKQIAEFKRSVEMFGQIRPIVCDENGVILAGNGLFDTLVAMGRTEADCYIVTDLSENQKKKLMLADNRIFDLGCDDMKAFDDIIAELGDDLDVPGFDEDLLATLIADSEEVDGIISEYGMVDEERKVEIVRQGENMTPPPAAPIRPAQAESAEEPEGKYVICPNCGEKIWL